MISILESRHRSDVLVSLPKNVLSDGGGVATIEYALVAGLIAIAALLGISELGGQVSDQWGGVDNEVGKAL